MDLADIARDFAAFGGLAKAACDTVCRRRVVKAETLGIDEFGFVDDPVDFLVLADEGDELSKPRLLGCNLVWSREDCRGDMWRDRRLPASAPQPR
jgi:hypothetical protein